MPSYKGHLLGSFCAYTITIFFISLGLPSWHISASRHAEWLLCTLLGGLFPDIDIKSKAQKLFYRIMFFAVCFFIIQKKFYVLAGLALFACVPLMVKHRGLLHNSMFIICLLGTIVIATIFFMPAATELVVKDAFFFLLGALSHIWLDFSFKRVIR